MKGFMRQMGLIKKTKIALSVYYPQNLHKKVSLVIIYN